ncbi:hypothetical protein F4694_003801 [Bacillus niacini]|uniref:Uncharacterized protein n=1 Tax=Neobacillus niacini TaxID=86668 RepID=A0A852TH17_9BACI|nr:hypothetical protein [Neobacillus niacini]NYE07016.1 hypothetical protein [Neobacillus niacini]
MDTWGFSILSIPIFFPTIVRLVRSESGFLSFYESYNEPG